MSKSNDQGNTWTEPVNILEQMLVAPRYVLKPDVAFDSSIGALVVSYYSNDNVEGEALNVQTAYSFDGGISWDFQEISDHYFIPKELIESGNVFIPDLSVVAFKGNSYCYWKSIVDDCETYALNILPLSPWKCPINCSHHFLNSNGLVNIDWDFEYNTEFKLFKVYLNGELISENSSPGLIYQLEEYGNYLFEISAVYNEDTESVRVPVNLQYGESNIQTLKDTLKFNIGSNQIRDDSFLVENKGSIQGMITLTSAMNNSTNLAEYCEAKGTGVDYLKGIRIQGLDFSNMASSYSSFQDVDPLKFQLKSGRSYSIELPASEIYEGDRAKIWVDWNMNGVFEEVEEKMMNVSETKTSTFVSSIEVPVYNKPLSTVMRIRRYSSSFPVSACGDSPYGEVEDYRLDLNSWLQLNSSKDTILPGETKQFSIQINSHGLNTGLYNSHIYIEFSDPTKEDLVIPVQLKVNNSLDFYAASSKQESCGKEEIQLKVEGPEDESLSFEWVSIPSGFNSTERNPVVLVDESRLYIVRINQNNEQLLESSVFIKYGEFACY